jgi:hypothetical protein
MSAKNEAVLEMIQLEHGLEIDRREAWSKLIERQFGGDRGRAFVEQIQNALDSYSPDAKWEDRLIKIDTRRRVIAITDFGEGMNRDRLRLLATLGGTDKHDAGYLGKFGIGFFAIFARALETKEVRVTTRCEGQTVELVFVVPVPGEPPAIRWHVWDKKLEFSTRIEIEFANSASVECCLDSARSYLQYFPCHILVNGKPFVSIWEQARHSRARFFKQGQCDGFLDSAGLGGQVTLLCKYERITSLSVPHMITGGRSTANGLRDFYQRDVPYLQHVSGTVNCNDLNVTISRDGFWLDWHFDNMVRSFGQALMPHLEAALLDHPDAQLIVANQYVLRNQIKAYLTACQEGKTPVSEESVATRVLRLLVETKVYRLSGRRELFSLADLAGMLSPGTPFVFAPRQTNLRWLGGDFKHDFIVLPAPCTLHDGAPDFYDDLFGCLFEDTLNLDTIQRQADKVRKLVERGVVDKAALMPKCKVIGQRHLTAEESRLCREIDAVLSHPEVRSAIARNLHMRIDRITSTFFDVEEQGITIATGVFDDVGRAVDEAKKVDDHTIAAPQNLVGRNDTGGPAVEARSYLGLRRSHPFVEHLVESDDPYRAYYGLTFLAHELAMCQKRLMPHSPFFHLVKEALVADMRRALLAELMRGRSDEEHAA